MKKFDNIYNDLIKQANTYTIMESEEGVQIQQPSADTKNAQAQKKSSGTYDWISNLILPTLLGASSASLIFGQGLFGLGKKNKFFGGWGGMGLGALGGALLLPGLWSDKSFGERITGSFSKLTAGDWKGAWQEISGQSPAADAVIKNGQEQSDKLSESAEQLEKRKNKYINTSDSGQKIFKWLNRNGYETGNFNIINDNIACFVIKPNLNNQKKKYGQKPCIGLVISTDKGAQAVMCNTNQVISLINQKFAGELRAAFTKKEEGNGFGNPELTQTNTKAIEVIEYISNAKSQDALELIGKIVWLNNGLKQLDISNLNYSEELFGGLKRALQNGLLLELPEDQDILKQQEATSVDDISNDFKNDSSAKDMKDDPTLNKFDEKLEKIQKKFQDINIQTLINSIDEANEKDPTAYIIQAKQGDKTYYYARKPDNNYLTDNIEETIYFSKDQVEKLDGSGDPKLKLQNTLQTIHMPQIMKMKNPGLKLYVKPINIQYLQKVSQVFKKYNINLNF